MDELPAAHRDDDCDHGDSNLLAILHLIFPLGLRVRGSDTPTCWLALQSERCQASCCGHLSVHILAVASLDSVAGGPALPQTLP